jgi:hypothetical protein
MAPPPPLLLLLLLLLLSAAASCGAAPCPPGFAMRAANLSSVLATPSVWTACEDLVSGRIVFTTTGSSGGLTLEKQLEPVWASDASAYLNFSKAEVLTAPGDLLGRKLLGRPGGFTLKDVAAAVPPIRTGIARFVGSRGSHVDISLDSQLEDANSLGIPLFKDAVTMHGGQVNVTGHGGYEGLIGSSLPILVFRLPDEAKDNAGGWWEAQYVPDASATGQQPLAVRFLRLDSGLRLVAWPAGGSAATSTAFPNGAAVRGQRYFDSYQYIPELYGAETPVFASFSN